nr:AAA family ATPase [Desulfovibrio sp.]
MLEYLRIRNLALIEDMSLEFAPGINVLTGETGAGKSFILKALNFVLGEKLSADIVRPGAEKAQVEALFVHEGEDLILRRELSAGSGRSRFYINDVMSSQDALKELRGKLISFAGQ